MSRLSARLPGGARARFDSWATKARVNATRAGAFTCPLMPPTTGVHPRPAGSLPAATLRLLPCGPRPRRCFLPVPLHAHSPSSRRQAGARMARAIKAQRCRQNTKAPHPAWRRPREKPPPTGMGAFARKRPDDAVGSVLCGPLQDDQRDPHVLLTTRHNTCRTRTDAAAAEVGRSPASACRRSRFPQSPR